MGSALPAGLQLFVSRLCGHAEALQIPLRFSQLHTAYPVDTGCETHMMSSPVGTVLSGASESFESSDEYDSLDLDTLLDDPGWLREKGQYILRTALPAILLFGHDVLGYPVTSNH
jgi:hypothetical protein